MPHNSLTIARFENAEFIIGNGLLIIGGLILTPNTFNELTVAGALMMLGGVILDIRVFNLSKLERDVLSKKIEVTKTQLDDALRDMQEMRHSIIDAERNLKRAITDMDEQEQKLKQQQKQLKEMEKTTFSFISRARSGRPLEDMLKEAYQSLDASLKSVEKKLGIWSSRRSPF
ncbi:hypothetical protein NVIE_022620 [Nitrososphaera viennensis EN76]|uniref:Uncharacterized protein n=2 Tax=Nitrososphaera viennensis TaxID=1034015 RepID=A0A060HIW9_9ARCH|nr:hypothetical protein NVIE_022620 [Nitrososphaera viennensis EN76]